MDRIGFFEESSGNKSVMRLISFLCVVGSIAMGIIQIVMEGDANETLVIGLAGAGLGAKAYQKTKEKSNLS